ncbi:MAG: peptidase [Candidatus Coatesbacteria bacterium]|nr:peptidase [Candidatus Coatesbacteria bacterium]
MYFGLFYLDWTLLLLVPGLLLGLWAQYLIKSRFKHYSQIRSRRGLSGAQTAAHLLADAGLADVEIEVAGGRLSDHYDPRKRKLRLSPDTAHSCSVAALGVAAHEVGHAVQHARDYFPLHLRNAAVPATRIGSWLFLPLFIAGLIFSLEPLIWIGVGLFAFTVVFQLVTLPVEFNASRRALAMLGDGGYLDPDEIGGARKVLGAAALTYVAGLVTSLLMLLRLLLLAGFGRR